MDRMAWIYASGWRRMVRGYLIEYHYRNHDVPFLQKQTRLITNHIVLLRIDLVMINLDICTNRETNVSRYSSLINNS
jgi:hypothetical protein